MAAVALLTVTIPFAALVSDRIGRRPVLIAGSLALLTVTYPLFTWLAAAPGIGRLLVMQLVICTIIGICYARRPRSPSSSRRVRAPRASRSRTTSR